MSFLIDQVDPESFIYQQIEQNIKQFKNWLKKREILVPEDVDIDEFFINWGSEHENTLTYHDERMLVRALGNTDFDVGKVIRSLQEQ
jgi:hypothetical protein